MNQEKIYSNTIKISHGTSSVSLHCFAKC